MKEYARVVLPSVAGVLNGLSYFLSKTLLYKTTDLVASARGTQY